MRPAWELGGHWSRAKSEEVHWVIASGLPKSPWGALKMTLRAASGTPGLARAKEVERSGCSPAWVVEVVVEKDSIASLAWAGAAKAAALRRPAATVSAAHSLGELISDPRGDGQNAGGVACGRGAFSHTYLAFSQIRP